MSSVMPVTADTFERDVLNAPIPVLVDFYADWCGPCQRLAPALERLAGEFSGQVRIVKVNVDDEPELANAYQVESIPALVVLSQGQVAGRTAGLVPEAGLRQALQRLIGANSLS